MYSKCVQPKLILIGQIAKFGQRLTVILYSASKHKYIFEIPVYKTDPVTSKYADGNHHSLSGAQLPMPVCTYT